MAVKITSDNMHDIGAVIRFHRKKAGLSRIDLADLAGIGKTALFDIEHGKTTVRLTTFLRILSVLNVALFLDGPVMGLFEGEADEKGRSILS